MSGSNALAAAKRRRVGAISVDKPPAQAPSRAVAKPVVNAINAPLRKPTGNSAVTQNQYRQSQPHQQQQTQQPSQPQPPVHPLQLLTMHDMTIKKIITEFPEALDSLGENFNVLSSNCDLLNERLEILENKNELSEKQAIKDPIKDPIKEHVKEIKSAYENDINDLLKSSSDNKKEIDEVKNFMISNLQTLAVELNKNFTSIVTRLETIEGKFLAYENALKNISSANDVLYELIKKVDMKYNDFNSKFEIISSSVENTNTQSQQIESQQIENSDKTTIENSESLTLPTNISLNENNDSNIILITNEIKRLEVTN